MRQIVQEHNPEPALSPSRKARKTLGAIRLAVLCGLTVGAVQKWDRSRGKGGLGGLVPAHYQARILRLARDEGLALTAEDLIAEAQP